MKPGPEPTFDRATQVYLAGMFKSGWTTYELAFAFQVSQFMTWKIVDRYVPLTHPRRRGRRRRKR